MLPTQRYFLLTILNYTPLERSDMMAKSIKQCHVCGKEYQYCPSCQYQEPSYKSLVCSEDCDVVWQILAKNGVGLINAKETLDALSKVKIPENLQEGIQAHIDHLKAEVKPVAKAPIVEHSAEIVVEEQQIESAKAYKRQKKEIIDEQPSQE